MKNKPEKLPNNNQYPENDFNYDDEHYEEEPNKECEKCGRNYDNIDFEYQCCSKCGWDADKQKWGEKREPTDEDYMNGEADILTGRWY